MNMRNLAATAAVLCGSIQLAAAWETGGHVFCDANQNGQIDSGDTPLTGVLVVVTNTSGTYSNATWTGAPDGGYVLDLPQNADSYVEYLHPDTLPGDATVVIPTGGVYAFSLDGVTVSNFDGDFLISSASCAGTSPPPPPPQTNGCCLKAAGNICNELGHFNFEGSVLPGCGSTNGDDGEWEITAPELKLHFQGSVFETVSCGEVPGPTNGCTLGYIEFQGVGTLKGACGAHDNYGVVYFYARAEQGCECGGVPDALYFRVYAADNTPLLLISTDLDNPLDIAPVAITHGHVRIGTDCCSHPLGDDDHGPDRDHGKKGEHEGGNCKPGKPEGGPPGHHKGEGSQCSPGKSPGKQSPGDSKVKQAKATKSKPSEHSHK